MCGGGSEWEAYLAVDVVHSQADLHELEHDGVLGQQLPGPGPDELVQVPILLVAQLLA